MNVRRMSYLNLSFTLVDVKLVIYIMPLDGRKIMFLIGGKDNKVFIDLHKERWYRVELMQEPSLKSGKVKIFIFKIRLNFNF